jgi:hypothetical protein
MAEPCCSQRFGLAGGEKRWRVDWDGWRSCVGVVGLAAESPAVVQLIWIRQLQWRDVLPDHSKHNPPDRHIVERRPRVNKALASLDMVLEFCCILWHRACQLAGANDGGIQCCRSRYARHLHRAPEVSSSRLLVRIFFCWIAGEESAEKGSHLGRGEKMKARVPL